MPSQANLSPVWLVFGVTLVLVGKFSGTISDVGGTQYMCARLNSIDFWALFTVGEMACTSHFVWCHQIGVRTNGIKFRPEISEIDYSSTSFVVLYHQVMSLLRINLELSGVEHGLGHHKPFCLMPSNNWCVLAWDGYYGKGLAKRLSWPPVDISFYLVHLGLF